MPLAEREFVADTIDYCTNSCLQLERINMSNQMNGYVPYDLRIRKLGVKKGNEMTERTYMIYKGGKTQE